MTSNSSQQADLVALMAGEIDTATLAARHGITEAEASRWREAFLAGMRASAGGQARVRRPHSRFVIVGVALLATAAFAQLVTFNANDPAMAADVNANFTQLKTWLEAKVGVVSDPGNITTPGKVTASGFAPTTAGGPPSGAISSVYATSSSLYVLGVPSGTGTRQITLAQSVAVTGNLSAASNTWDSNTEYAEYNFNTPNTATPSLNWANCPNGTFMCGIGVGHIANDNNYWTGARIAMKCCAL